METIVYRENSEPLDAIGGGIWYSPSNKHFSGYAKSEPG